MVHHTRVEQGALTDSAGPIEDGDLGGQQVGDDQVSLRLTSEEELGIVVAVTVGGESEKRRRRAGFAGRVASRYLPAAPVGAGSVSGLRHPRLLGLAARLARRSRPSGWR